MCGNRVANGVIVGCFLHGPIADPWVRRFMHEKDSWTLSRSLSGNHQDIIIYIGFLFVHACNEGGQIL